MSMRIVIRLALSAAMLAGAPAIVSAQFPAQIAIGKRVRVWVPEPYRQMEGPLRRQVLRGTVDAVAPGSLRLTVPGASGALEIPRGSVRRIEVSQGVSRPASAIERAVGGALGGAVTWAAMNDPRRRGGPHYRTDWRAAGVGATWGGAFGAVVGFAFPSERWKRVRMRR